MIQILFIHIFNQTHNNYEGKIMMRIKNHIHKKIINFWMILWLLQNYFYSHWHFQEIIVAMYKNILEQSQDKTIQTEEVRKKKPFKSTNLIKEGILKSKTINYKIKSKTKDLWTLSATSMTRDISPSFKIPQSGRFESTQRQRTKNPHILSFQLRKCLDRGVSFTKSCRRDHFVKRQSSQQPSSASYFQNQKKKDENQFQFFNPESIEKVRQISYPSTSYGSRNKGHKFKSFENYDKQYLHHGRQMNYQPQTTIDNPGVGKYEVNVSNVKQESPSYSIRKILKRFNDFKNFEPGPSTYQIKYSKPNKHESINKKGTFQRSGRQFLVNPDNQTPGPGAYSLFD